MTLPSVIDNQCRRKVEMSPDAQSRNDTPDRRAHLARNGITALRWARSAGSRAETGLPARDSAALEADGHTQHHRKAVRQSVAAIPARRLDRGQVVEVQIDDHLQRFRSRCFT